MKCEYCGKQFDKWKVEEVGEAIQQICPYCGAPDTFNAEEYAKELEREAMWSFRKANR